MTEKIVMGLDLSLTASGYAIFGAEDKFLHWGTVEPPSQLETLRRIQWTVLHLKAIITSFQVTEVAIEDYAYSQFGVSGSIAQIVENAGAVKQMLIGENIQVFCHSITEIKKHATGIGKASKDQMLEAYQKLTHKRKSGDEHQIDAFFVAMFHYEYLRRLDGKDT